MSGGRAVAASCLFSQTLCCCRHIEQQSERITNVPRSSLLLSSFENKKERKKKHPISSSFSICLKQETGTTTTTTDQEERKMKSHFSMKTPRCPVIIIMGVVLSQPKLLLSSLLQSFRVEFDAVSNNFFYSNLFALNVEKKRSRNRQERMEVGR